MPYYPGLKSRKFDTRRRFVAQRLIALRKALSADVPAKTLDQNLLIATWNLRDFGRPVPEALKERRLNPAPRLPESFYYIAEIMSRFDLIAVQEVNEHMEDFLTLMKILGSHFDYIATDVTEGLSGNGERMVFVYDTRKVTFRNIAGEIVLPKEYKGMQFVRTPFVVSFQSGWFKFDLCTSHLLYGSDDAAGREKRAEEIRTLASFMKERADRNGANTFILGDFNVVGPGDVTWDALQKSGFTVPKAIQQFKTNISGTKHYDQIAFHSVRWE